MSHSLCVWTPLRYNTQPSPLRHNTRQGLLIKVRGLRRLRLAGDRLEDGQKARLNSELVHLRTHESGSISRTLTAPDRDAPSSPSLSIGPSSQLPMVWLGRYSNRVRPRARDSKRPGSDRLPCARELTGTRSISLSFAGTTAADRDAPLRPSLSIGPSSHSMAWEAFEPRPPAREGQQKTRLRSPPVCPRTHRNAIDLSLSFAVATTPDRGARSGPPFSAFPSAHGTSQETFEPRSPAREGQQKTRFQSPLVCPRTHRNAIDLSLLCSCNYRVDRTRHWIRVDRTRHWVDRTRHWPLATSPAPHGTGWCGGCI